MTESDDRRGLNRMLDGAEAVASLIYVVLLAILAGAVLTALGYIFLNSPKSWGSQGEWLYVGVGILLVIGWLMSKLTWLLQRRRSRRDDEDRSFFPSPNIEFKPSGFSLEWGSPSAERKVGKANAFTWNFESAPIATTTFRLDETQLATVRSARAADKNWEEIARQVNPGYGELSAFEKSLYQRALQMAFDSYRGQEDQISPKL